MEAQYHELKTWPEYYDAILHDFKKFEIRENDRDYKTGDVLLLKKYNPDTKEYTGEELAVKVTFLLEGGSFGLEEGYVIMSINKII